MSKTINKVVDEIESLFNSAELDNEPLTVRVDTGVLFTDAGKKQCTAIISAALSEREEKVETLREYSADLVRVIRRGDCGDFSPIMDEIFDVEAALSALGE